VEADSSGRRFGQRADRLVDQLVAPHRAQRPLHVPVGGDHLAHPADAGAGDHLLRDVRRGAAGGGDDDDELAVVPPLHLHRHPELAGEHPGGEQPGEVGVELVGLDEGEVGVPDLRQRGVQVAPGDRPCGQEHRAERLADPVVLGQRRIELLAGEHTLLDEHVAEAAFRGRGQSQVGRAEDHGSRRRLLQCGHAEDVGSCRAGEQRRDRASHPVG
jgi:hypothetical protein